VVGFADGAVIDLEGLAVGLGGSDIWVVRG